VAHVLKRARTTPGGDGAWYDEFPRDMTEPFKSRRRKVGYDLYALAGVARDDMQARARQGLKNFTFFGAPVGLFFSVDRQFGIPQFVDLGIFLQAIMLMARTHGLHTCAQESWSMWHLTVSEFLGIPDNERMFCGMALGYADDEAEVNRLQTERVSLDEFAKFVSD
jgi:nitroreductase